jgi:7-keto-8-aminopelargonate synthetase-like enzyme
LVGEGKRSVPRQVILHMPLQDIHKQLEQQICKFHNTEAAILYPSCFDANAGLFEAILTADDAVISDQLNHASIIDGVRLCKAKRYRRGGTLSLLTV